MFNREKREEGSAALRTEVERLGALSLPALGAEVMTRVFGPGGDGADPSVTLNIVTAANAFITDESAWSNEDDVRNELVRVVGEGLQACEHASLIRSEVMLVGTEHWALGWTVTRTGQQALTANTVAQALGA
jgi:hypothetical protein